MSHTGNPRAPQIHPSDAPQESVGAVVSDSLAAESIKSGGAFSENENANIMSVKGSNSTFNTTDTSGATALHSAPDGATREKQDALGLGSDQKGVTGVKYDAASNKDFSGVHNQDGYVGGGERTGSGYQTKTGGTASGATGDSFADGGAGITGSSATKTTGISSGSGHSGQGVGKTDTTDTNTTSASASSRTDPDTAPNYAATVAGNIRSEGELKPKGANLTEGDIPKTKTFTGNVGGDKDPGRLAEQGFQKVSAENAASAGEKRYGGSGNSEDIGTGGQYDVLQTERAP